MTMVTHAFERQCKHSTPTGQHSKKKTPKAFEEEFHHHTAENQDTDTHKY
jgi:hypothetical protein